MGLLKAIKYSTFEVSVQKEIVDECLKRMNIFGGFFIPLIGQTRT